MCDFCGAFTDIDFAVGIETWNENPLSTAGYQLKKADLMSRSQAALAKGDGKVGKSPQEAAKKLQAALDRTYSLKTSLHNNI